MTRAEKIAHNRAEKRIDKAYRATCCNIGISVLDIGKVFRVGHEAIREGADDAALAARLRAFVDTIKVGA